MNIPRIISHTLCATPLLVALALAAAPAAHAESFYAQHNLVSDKFVPADHIDPNDPKILVNAWGVSFNPTGAVWVANNGSGTSTLYDGAGNPLSLVVEIPSPSDPLAGGNPTGIVFNGTPDFVVSKNGVSGASRFIFATEDGVIAGWAPTVDGTHAVPVVDNSATTGAVYKGLAIIAGGNNSMLYAADFHNNKIDVFDRTFAKKALTTGAFVDPMLPKGYAPFGVQAINGEIYVSYAKRDQDNPDNNDEVQGPGFGYVDVFDPNGRFIQRAASAGKLNAPWGIALAPAGFGQFSGRLLVGNFGDGKINAYDVATGRYVGHLEDANDQPIKIEGLWGIAFGNGFLGQPVNSLFFAAGPGDEAHGLYGRIDVDMTADGEHDHDRHEDRHDHDRHGDRDD
jgi:uncharacterized protein (TIGR03118 family)